MLDKDLSGKTSSSQPTESNSCVKTTKSNQRDFGFQILFVLTSQPFWEGKKLDAEIFRTPPNRVVATTQNSASENTEKQQHSLKHTLCSVPCELKNSTCCASKNGTAQSGIRILSYHPCEVGWRMKTALHRHQEKKLEPAVPNHVDEV